MKTKQLLLIVLVLCSTYCFSQKKYLVKYSAYNAESIYSYNANDKLEKDSITIDVTLTREYIYNKDNLCERVDAYQILGEKRTRVNYVDYVYDTNGNRAKRTNYNISFKNPEEFILGGVINYTYDENNKLIKQETCSVEDGKEIPYSRINYTYEKGLLTSWHAYSGNYYDPDAEWILDTRGGYLYDTEGQLVVDSLMTIFDGEEQAGTKKEYSYDKNGNLVNFNYYIPSRTKLWFLQISHSYEYDLSLSAKDYVLPINPEDPEGVFLFKMNNERTKENYYSRDDITNEMGLVKSYTYEYQLASGIESNKITNDLLIYPNPVENTFTINSLTKDAPLYIYDAEGRLVVSYNNVDSIIEVSNLNPGIYFVKYGNKSVKMIKKSTN